ncbi:MAG: hypothetical protein JWM58_2987 [Rhizobium sp.]|nr:hypothetical protein [Rhizobium sp.]
MTTTKVTTNEARAGLINEDGAKWAGNITYSIPGAGSRGRRDTGTESRSTPSTAVSTTRRRTISALS